MDHVATADVSITTTPAESRQARLDAAIALFRSEASASGYVVEEVRLRLPVPDVDVMPRVIIAQQSASSGAPPSSPRAKPLRTLSSYPSPNAVPGDYSSLPVQDIPHANHAKRSYGVPGRMTTDQNVPGNPGTKSASFKRTVSGSVIFRPESARTKPSNREDNTVGPNSTPPQKVDPLSSNPCLPAEGGRLSLLPNSRTTGQFWKTVIGGEQGKQILQAIEGMQRLRHADVEHRLQKRQRTEESAAVEISEPLQGSAANVKLKQEHATAESQQPETLKTKDEENTVEGSTHHISGHDIPESHVQLLLSSAADISARGSKSATKASGEISYAATRTAPDEKKRPSTKPQAKLHGNPSSTKATSVSNGKQYTRKRSSDRRTGSAAARPYRCTKCPSSFDREGHLRVHILAVHEKKRPFVCQVCDASFGHSSSLLRHVRTVHQASPAVGSGRTSNSSRNTPNSNNSGTTSSETVYDNTHDECEKHFRCSVCGMAFDRVAVLNRHVAEQHPLQTSLADNEDKPTKSP